MTATNKDATRWSAADVNFMQQALQLATKGMGHTSPNPMVGTVIVSPEGTVVGTGYHRLAGGPHAEVYALQAAGNRAQGATAYVTLEPCSHYGRTPPCANALIESGVARVVIAMTDPNPQVAGQGIERLKDAGIKTELGLLHEEATAQNEVFLTYMQAKRPFMHFKTAMSLDGKIACHTGASQWITGPQARQEVHRLRSLHDAIMVGSGTALADDPRLTVRLDNEAPGPVGPGQPTRIIIDSRGRLPLNARCLEGAGETAQVIVAVTEQAPNTFRKALRNKNVKVWSAPAVDGRVDINKLLGDLAQMHITSIFVESGPTFAGSLFDLGLVDRVTAFIAPLILGGAAAPSPVAGNGVDHPDKAWTLQHIQRKQFGPDTMITGRVQPR